MKARNVLAVGAHGDDIEIGCGGVVAKHAKAGDNVYMLVMTTPEYTNYDGTVLRGRAEGEIETVDGAKIMGAKLVQLDFDTKNVPYNGESVEAINKVIDDYDIDTIYTHWLHDTHQDHMRTTKSVFSAARYVSTILMYEPEYPAGRSYLGFRNQYYVDISDTFEAKLEAIKKHVSQIKKYEPAGFLEAIEGRCRHRGYQIGRRYAETFEVLRMLDDI